MLESRVDMAAASRPETMRPARAGRHLGEDEEGEDLLRRHAGQLRGREMIVEDVEGGPHEGEVRPDRNRGDGAQDDALSGFPVRLHGGVTLDRHLVGAHDLEEEEEVEQRRDPERLLVPGEMGFSDGELPGRIRLAHDLLQPSRKQRGHHRHAQESASHQGHPLEHIGPDHRLQSSRPWCRRATSTPKTTMMRGSGKPLRVSMARETA